MAGKTGATPYFLFSENRELYRLFRATECELIIGSCPPFPQAFFDACHVFADKCLLTVYDEGHSADEERWISMGQISNGKILVVVHTYKCTKNREFVRIISARMANEKESREYLTRRF